VVVVVVAALVRAGNVLRRRVVAHNKKQAVHDLGIIVVVAILSADALKAWRD